MGKWFKAFVGRSAVRTESGSHSPWGPLHGCRLRPGRALAGQRPTRGFPDGRVISRSRSTIRGGRCRTWSSFRESAGPGRNAGSGLRDLPDRLRETTTRQNGPLRRHSANRAGGRVRRDRANGDPAFCPRVHEMNGRDRRGVDRDGSDSSESRDFRSSRGFCPTARTHFRSTTEWLWPPRSANVLSAASCSPLQHEKVCTSGHYRTSLDYLLISGILRFTLVKVVNSRILNNL